MGSHYHTFHLAPRCRRDGEAASPSPTEGVGETRTGSPPRNSVKGSARGGKEEEGGEEEEGGLEKEGGGEREGQEAEESQERNLNKGISSLQKKLQE